MAHPSFVAGTLTLMLASALSTGCLSPLSRNNHLSDNALMKAMAEPEPVVAQEPLTASRPSTPVVTPASAAAHHRIHNQRPDGRRPPLDAYPTADGGFVRAPAQPPTYASAFDSSEAQQESSLGAFSPPLGSGVRLAIHDTAGLMFDPVGFASTSNLPHRHESTAGTYISLDAGLSSSPRNEGLSTPATLPAEAVKQPGPSTPPKAASTEAFHHDSEPSASEGHAGSSSASEPVNSEKEPSDVVESAEAKSPEKESAPNAWRDSLEEAIALLEVQANGDEPLGAAKRERLQLLLRLLHLANSDRVSALRAVESHTPEKSASWRHLVQATSLLVETGRRPEDIQIREVLDALRAAETELTKLSALQVNNIQFCKTVNDFGDFETFKQTAYKPGQKVLLYFEIDNLHAEQSRGGYYTELCGSVQIYRNTQVVAARELPTVKDSCRVQRRDFYVFYTFTVPTDLESGEYTLSLEVEDKQANKFGAGTLSFRVQ